MFIPAFQSRLRRAAAALLLPAGLLAGCGGPPASVEPPPPGMVRIPGGAFKMGTDDSGFEFEGPVHTVRVRPFYLDAHEVTNARFAAFVAATGYRTVAEKWGWSGVFNREKQAWERVNGASWRRPRGPGSGIKGRDGYPVVQVCHEDAVAYCAWAGMRLPTEAEWEFAARGGLERRIYPWGNTLRPGGRFMANFWQGTFPRRDLGLDGYAGLAPVGRFPPNGYGLHDMAGNVWEWVGDRYAPDYYRSSPAENPAGPAEGDLFVIRGGSFLCAENFCQGYRAAARNSNGRDSATDHTGFRCAKDAP